MEEMTKVADLPDFPKVFFSVLQIEYTRYS